MFSALLIADPGAESESDGTASTSSGTEYPPPPLGWEGPWPPPDWDPTLDGGGPPPPPPAGDGGDEDPWLDPNE
jgi:hypothetical protein